MKPSRLLDALCNRTREGLRVIEDIARFMNDDALLTKKLKDFRHQFLIIEREIFSFYPRLRHASSDVGKRLAAPTSSKRSHSRDIENASWARVQESLRSLEETLKIEKTPLSRKTERLRFLAYELQSFSNRSRADQWPLYALITHEFCEHPLEKLIPLLIQAGVGAIQLREKKFSDKQILARARTLKRLVGSHPTKLILNDRPDLAVAAGFDGVHIGQSDIPPKQIKKIFGHQLFVGLSTHTVSQAQNAENLGADYIGIGPVFPTTTKPHLKFIGTKEAKKMIRSSQLPHVCIGGIGLSNVKEIHKIGGQGIAMCTGITQAKNPKDVVKKILKSLKKS